MKIQILDCTLRDGGYVNGWRFGRENIRRIIAHLVSANVGIIECGFLKQGIAYDPDKSLYAGMDDLKSVLPANRKREFVCMINYGEYDPDALPPCDGASADGIRVTFHKEDKAGALDFCRKIAQKGYRLFLQPMVTAGYSDRELLELMEEANALNPYAFYIVDSFGVMRKNDLLRIFYLVEKNLSEKIKIGYHSHNNLQLAYSNAQSLLETHTKRDLIIDSSVFGMGRGAGNLNTELLVEHLNANFGGRYKVYPLLQIIDETLNKAYAENHWGYSLPHYLSSVCNCHPNYASYLSDKNTLTIKAISEILSLIPENKKDNFDRAYIEEMYLSYQKHFVEDADALRELYGIFDGRDVAIVAPGRSVATCRERILSRVGGGSLMVSVNFFPEGFQCDFAFFSNRKRYDSLADDRLEGQPARLIVTSNIRSRREGDIVVNYAGLLNSTDAVEDNSVLMLLKLLIGSNARSVLFAGFDGYTYDTLQNYAERDMVFNTNLRLLDEMNRGIVAVIREYASKIRMEFLTPSKYQEML